MMNEVPRFTPSGIDGGNHKNNLFPLACVHVKERSLPPVAVLTIATLEDVDDDFRYGTAPDHMQLCAFCQGSLWAAASQFPMGDKRPVTFGTVLHMLGAALSSLFVYERDKPK